MLYFNKELNATSTIYLTYSKRLKDRISFDGLNEQAQGHEFCHRVTCHSRSCL